MTAADTSLAHEMGTGSKHRHRFDKATDIWVVAVENRVPVSADMRDPELVELLELFQESIEEYIVVGV